MLPTEKWLKNLSKILQSENVDEDRYAQCATWLLGRVNNMIHRPNQHSSNPVRRVVSRPEAGSSKMGTYRRTQHQITHVTRRRPPPRPAVPLHTLRQRELDTRPRPVAHRYDPLPAIRILSTCHTNGLVDTNRSNIRPRAPGMRHHRDQ